jgi:hypothetical protein
MYRPERVWRQFALTALCFALSSPAGLAMAEGIDIGGSVAGSYFYNTNTPGDGMNDASGGQYFHPNHNEFQIDQAVISFSREKTEESRLGFQVRAAYGALGQFQGNGDTGGNGFWLADAYLDYACDCFGGFDLVVGKFGTHIGYETAFVDENVNITRGFTWGIQPVDQIGVRLYKSFGGLDLMLGSVTGFTADQPDIDDQPDLVWSIGSGGDGWAASFNGQFDGSDELDSGAAATTKGVTLDAILELTPQDSLLVWLNATSNIIEDGPDNLGVSLGSHLAITEKLGAGGRAEFITFEGADDLIAITGTVDYMLIENLVAKFEVKWDYSLDDEIFDPSAAGGAPREESQVLLAAQLFYTF